MATQSYTASGKEITPRPRTLAVDVAYQTNADGSYRLDKYQRRLGRLMVDGENAGRILIERGLAEAYSGGKRRDWCG